MTIKEETNRFVLLNDEEQEIGEMTWSNAGDHIMIIDHTYVDPTYRGQHLAEKLVAKGVEKARRKGKKSCRYVRLQKKNLIKKLNIKMC